MLPFDLRGVECKPVRDLAQRASKFFEQNGFTVEEPHRIDPVGKNDGFRMWKDGREFRCLCCVVTRKMKERRNTITMTDFERGWVSGEDNGIFVRIEHEDGPNKHVTLKYDQLVLIERRGTIERPYVICEFSDYIQVKLHDEKLL